MAKIHRKGGLFLKTILFVSFNSSKTKNIPEGKNEINGKILEIFKYHYYKSNITTKYHTLPPLLTEKSRVKKAPQFNIMKLI